MSKFLDAVISNDIDTEILNKDVISKVGEDNILFLSYMIFGMNFGSSVTRIVKYYLQQKKHDLVITLIVLLILAGISITMLAGENGILSMAKEAKEKTNAAKED